MSRAHLHQMDVSPAGVDLVDEEAVCAILGGSRPIHPSTLRRGIRAGIYPKPVKIGSKTNRWLKSEVAATIARCAAERGSNN